MKRALRAVDVTLLPSVGIVFGVLWIIGAANRISDKTPIEWIPFALIGVGIGLARISPLSAISLSVVTLALQVAVPRLRFNENGWSAYVGLLLVVLIAVASPRIRTGIIALVVGLLGGATVGILVGAAGGDPIAGMLLSVVAVLATGAVGLAVRFYQQRNAELKRSRILELEVAASATELAIALERDRTAQDVHDIMAHSLAVIVAQADGALFLGEKRPNVASESLAAIAQSARESLGELRVLLQSLASAPDGHSYPSLADIDILLARMREVGLNVTDHTFGEPSGLTAGQQVAVYRIVQESLTNALKHIGPEAIVRITRDWRGPGLALGVVSIADTAIPDSGPTQFSRGITGMTERARLAGGWLAAERDNDDPRCFVVTAFIPTAAVASSGELTR
jgi:signal transduction histidine kinase